MDDCGLILKNTPCKRIHFFSLHPYLKEAFFAVLTQIV